MTKRTKQISLILLLGSLVSLLLLASSLSNLQLQAGNPFPGGADADRTVQPVQPLSHVETYSFAILRGIFALIFLILLIYVLARLITLVNIKKMLWLVLAMGVLIFLAYMMPLIPPGQPVYYPEEPSGIINPPSIEYPTSPLGQPPQALIWLVIIGVVLGVSIPTIKIVKQRLGPNQIKAEFLQEAEDAVNALEAGVDLRNVIMRCYVQMTRSLREERGIERNYTMTVREFEGWLEFLGFPAAPVHRLTSLFEKVRYGNQKLIANDEEMAIESLNEIIQYCRSGKA